jgi:solute carrier family 45 protein 1/2/4
MNMMNDIRSGGIIIKMIGGLKGLMGSIQDGSAWAVPIKWLTLVRLWWISQFTFAGAMALTWWVHSVS